MVDSNGSSPGVGLGVLIVVPINTDPRPEWGQGLDRSHFGVKKSKLRGKKTAGKAKKVQENEPGLPDEEDENKGLKEKGGK